jgi:hypothetical protein
MSTGHPCIHVGKADVIERANNNYVIMTDMVNCFLNNLLSFAIFIHSHSKRHGLTQCKILYRYN